MEPNKDAEARRKEFADRQPQNFSPEYLSPNVNENQLGEKELGHPDPHNPDEVGRVEPSAEELANVHEKDEPAHEAREAQRGVKDKDKDEEVKRGRR